MNRIWKIVGNEGLLKVSSIITLFVYVLLLVVNTPSEFVFHNNDNYKGAFSRFLEKGYYDSVSEGTTILYNVFLKGIYSITNNVESAFIVLNSLCQLFLIGFGYYFLKKYFKKVNIYFLILFGLYLLFTINLKSFAGASNDAFLGVFVIVLLHLLVQKLFINSKNQYLIFASIGLLLALCFSIRMTAILLIPLIALTFVIWFMNSNANALKKMFKILTSILTFIVITSMLHYPSLKENSKLSTYDKNPEKYEANWTQRNYLGLKKIERGDEPVNRDVIWYKTKFNEVDKYLKENGEDSLPKSFFEVLKRDPILALKMFAYNFSFSILRFFRFWGLLFFVLIIPFFNLRSLKKLVFSKENLPSNLFLFYLFMLTFVCFTFIEFRWFIGYEILIPIAVLSQINRHHLFNKDINKNILFTVSLVFVTLFNLRSIINLI